MCRFSSPLRLCFDAVCSVVMLARTALLVVRAFIFAFRLTRGVILGLHARSFTVPLAYVQLLVVIALLVALYAGARLLERRMKQRKSAHKKPGLRDPSRPLLSGGDVKLISTALEVKQQDPPARIQQFPQFSIAGDSLCEPPRIHSYQFRHTDLVRGPADPHDFYDDFFVEMEDAGDGHRYTQQFTVATPAGLERMMREERVGHLFPEDLLVVSSFNLGEVLTAIAARYADWQPAGSSRESVAR
jgi:uncharacterized integral membrane protein